MRILPVMLMNWDDTELTPPGGYRLARLEAFNWGTFRGCWVLAADGHTSLLTGANGSGKSTLVDALLTLLVPTRGTGGRNYNQAAGTGQRAERTERSYVLGAYGQIRDEESGSSQIQYLRDKKPTYSVLLGVFENIELEKVVSLAQVFTMQNGNMQKFYVVAEVALDFQTHFRTEQSVGQTLKPRLRKLPAVKVFDKFKDYSAEFRRLFNLGEKALDLFNQIVSIKDIGELNDFVRRHMLEEFDAQTIISRLQENYQNLTEAHKAIEKARKQLELLDPLLKNVERHYQQQERIRDTQHKSDHLPTYIAYYKSSLLSDKLYEIEGYLNLHRQQHEEQVQVRERLRQEAEQLQQAIASDDTSRRLKNLQDDLDQLKIELSTRQRNAKHYQELVHKARLHPAQNTEDFVSNRLEAEIRLIEEKTSIGQLEQEIVEHEVSLRNLRQQGEKLERELEALRERKSLIPPDDLHIRADLAKALRLPEEEFPFVGELLKVREEQSQWEPAIQRLLNGFGRQVLVPEVHYHAVSEYVERHNLRGRLVYHRINEISPVSEQQLTAQSLYHKLQIKPETDFRGWLQSQLIRAYDYTCCETLAEFRRAHHRAVTINGQIKHGGDRHEKDDRRSLGDRRSYVLGWDNQQKRHALQQDLDQIGSRYQEIQALIQQLQQDKTATTTRRQSLDDLLRLYEKFEQIDWAETSALLSHKQQDYNRLKTAPEAHRYQLLEQQLSQVKKEISQTDDLIGRLSQEIGHYQGQQVEYQRQKQRTEEILAQHDLAALSPIINEIDTDRKADFSILLTLDNLDMVQNSLRQSYDSRNRNQERRLREMEQEILVGMSGFKNAYPTETTDVDVDLAAAGWFQEKLEQIKHHDLPQHEKRFRELMHSKVTQSIDTFQSSLIDQKNQYQKRIDHLNQSLREIPYTSETYIQLICENTQDQQIKQFRTALRECHPNVGVDGDAADEMAFQRIHALLEKFKTEVTWTERVTDVRRWLDFAAEELSLSDGSHRQRYDSSSGKSGGQKAKLAYTILASAVAYQYGLFDDTQDLRKTFRFVVVDEVFSKSDENNSRFAMDLFQKLNLQVLVVTPSDKLHIVEDYIGTCHFVWNKNGDDSRVVTMPMEKLKEMRAAEGTSGYDYTR